MIQLISQAESRSEKTPGKSKDILAGMSGVAGIALASVGTGFVAASGDYVPIGISAALASMTILICLPRASASSVRHAKLVTLIFALYLCPLVMLGRAFAVVGHSPVYLPDVLLLGAVLAMLPVSGLALRRLAPLPVLWIAVAALALHAVYVGTNHAYPGALKGMVLVFYPLVALVTAAWLCDVGDADRLLSFLPRYVLPLVTVGLAGVVATGASFIESSYGLYLGIAAAFAATPRVPHRRTLALITLLGAILLVAVSPKRGVGITLIFAPLAAWLASSRSRSGFRTTVTALGGLAVAMTVALTVSVGAISPTSVPVAGPLYVRATNQTVNAAHNVGLREAMWSYALRTTYSDDPLLGVGVYHPIEITYFGNDISRYPDTGVHNSFVGYAFYAGFPAGLLVVLLFVTGLVRVWRIRGRSDYAPAMFGALVAVVLTALTNVALETTYIGGPSWLVLGAAAGLAASHSAPRPAGTRDSMDGASATPIPTMQSVG